uniref:Uncharacterized protein n=1 Tax=Rhizophora mucronata TaxID=61149 RepID=A0A2P2NAY6_RHIMU
MQEFQQQVRLEILSVTCNPINEQQFYGSRVEFQMTRFQYQFYTCFSSQR